MSSSTDAVVLKKRLLNRLKSLSEIDIREVLDFVEFLQIKRHKTAPLSENAQLDPEKDPILKLMGIADVESFADMIDQELYGK